MPEGKKRQIRQRRSSSSDEEEKPEETKAVGGPDLNTILRDTKELQKLRQRPHGVTAAALALGAKMHTATASGKIKELEEEDPWKVGGLIDPKKEAAKDRNRDRTAEEDKDVVNMEHTFAAETNQRDEDAEMCKYIEEEMQKRKMREKEQDEEGEQDPLESDPVFSALPEHLKTTYKKRGEEMLSSQMLSGIPEVDLGIGEKIRNIEQTEKAKKELLERKLAERQKKQNSFAPANMAVNFVQHNRFNLDESKPKPKEKSEEKKEPQPLVVGMAEKNPALATANVSGPKKHKPDSASDDYHFDKFKKAMRR